MAGKLSSGCAVVLVCGVAALACDGGGAAPLPEAAAPDPDPGAPSENAGACPPAVNPGRPPEGRTTSWVRQLGGGGDEFVISVATAGDGTATVLTSIGAAPWDLPARPEALGLVRLDRAGAILWARELTNPHAAELERIAMAVSPEGSIVLAADLRCAPGGCAGRLPRSRDGRAEGVPLLEWLRRQVEDDPAWSAAIPPSP